jgi:hypothetical protein
MYPNKGIKQCVMCFNFQPTDVCSLMNIASYRRLLTKYFNLLKGTKHVSLCKLKSHQILSSLRIIKVFPDNET